MLRHRALLSSAAGRRACSVLRPAKLHITSNESNYYEKEISCKIYRQANDAWCERIFNTSMMVSRLVKCRMH